MSHFHKMPSRERISAQTLTVDGNAVTIGLSEYKDPSGEELSVMADNSTVRPYSQAIAGDSRLYILNGEAGAAARIEVFNSAMVRLDFFNVKFAGVPAGAAPAKYGKLETRRNVVLLARTFVGAAHYLNGGYGDRPGRDDGYHQTLRKRTQKDPPSFDPAKPSILAAYTEVRKRKVCAGSYTKVPGGREVGNPRTDAVLLKYLAEQKKNSLEGKPLTAQGNLSPRMHKGKVVWGEACHDKAHFDCITLVNHCVAQYAKDGNLWGWAISQYMLGTAKTKRILDPKDILSGDLVGQLNEKDKDNPKLDFGWHHIGMIYLEGDKPKVVQAVDTEVGLTDGEDYSPTGPKWTRRVRLVDDVFK